MTRCTAVAWVTTAVLIVGGCASKGNPEAEQAAIASAEAWLGLVDGQRYTESWEEAAGLFRGAVTVQQWEQTMRAARAPLGQIVSRKLKSKRYVTSLPGAPDGQYVVIRYSTSLEHKESAVETITPLLDQDGTWRVSGYFIR